MSGSADGLNNIFDHNVLIREYCTAKNFVGNVFKTPTSDLELVNKKYVDDAGHWERDSVNGYVYPKVATDNVYSGDDFLSNNVLGKFGWAGDTNTFIQGLGDRIVFTVGGLGLLDLHESNTQDAVRVNGNLNQDVDFQVGYNAGTSIFSEGSSGNVGIGTSSPSAKFEIKASSNGNLGGFLLRDSGSGLFPALLYQTNSEGRFELYSAGNKNVVIRAGAFDSYFNGGNVGIGTSTPTQPLSVKEKVSMTAIGGIAIKLTNKTGANSVAGQLVKASTGTNDATELTAIDEEECIGVFLESGIADGAEAWVVVSGIADVAMEDNTASTRGNWVRTSITEAGYADSTNASPPSPAAFSHFNEIGHCIESVAAGGAGTHILARCVLHFN